jgi:hypothetical protein
MLAVDGGDQMKTYTTRLRRYSVLVVCGLWCCIPIQSQDHFTRSLSGDCFRPRRRATNRVEGRLRDGLVMRSMCIVFFELATYSPTAINC